VLEKREALERKFKLFLLKDLLFGDFFNSQSNLSFKRRFKNQFLVLKKTFFNKNVVLIVH